MSLHHVPHRRADLRIVVDDENCWRRRFLVGCIEDAGHMTHKAPRVDRLMEVNMVLLCNITERGRRDIAGEHNGGYFPRQGLLDLGDDLEPVEAWEIIIGHNQIEAHAAIGGNGKGLIPIAGGKCAKAAAVEKQL